MRLDKFLALEGRCTRSGAKEQLRRGRVTVNGAAARDGAQAVDPEKDTIALDGETLRYRSEMHLMLNKPAGVLTAANDPRCRTVMDLLPRACAAMGCMPVGRLDLDTEGLLLFTTDGQLAHRLLAPKHGVEKVYIARVDGILTEEDAAAFARGLQLSDFMARPARLEILPPGDTGRVTVCEGEANVWRARPEGDASQAPDVRRHRAGRSACARRVARIDEGGARRALRRSGGKRK